MRIQKLYTATKREWDEIHRTSDYSTYFHSREWYDHWVRHPDLLGAPKCAAAAELVHFSDGSRALLPLLSLGSGGYISSPGGTYGGFISSDNLQDSHFTILISLYEHYSGLQMRFNPFGVIPKPNITAIDRVSPDETQCADLSAGFPILIKKWKQNTLWEARKAQKLGISIGIAKTMDEWKAYFNAYQSSLQRWSTKATSRYPWTFFNDLMELKSDKVKLWLAFRDDDVIAGALCFYAKKHVVYWHGAAHSDSFKFHPVQLLMYEIINDACAKNYQWFDFNPSGTHQGVRGFKANFGVEYLSCPFFEFAQRSPDKNWFGPFST